jgi:hypothetical protein
MYTTAIGLGLHVSEGQPLMSGTEYKVQFAQNLQGDTSMGIGRTNSCPILPSQNTMCTTVRVLFPTVLSNFNGNAEASLIPFERRKVTRKRTVTGGYDQSDLLPAAHLLK